MTRWSSDHTTAKDTQGRHHGKGSGGRTRRSVTSTVYSPFVSQQHTETSD